MNDSGLELLRQSPITRFADPAAMAAEVRALESDGYRCMRLDASAWTGEADFHTAVAAALDFPVYYGHNFAAFNDCIKTIDVAGHRGLVLVFARWEAFAAADGVAAWHVLDIIACASRFRLVYGDRLLALVHVSDPGLRIEPVGRVGVVPSMRERRMREQEAMVKVRGDAAAKARRD